MRQDVWRGPLGASRRALTLRSVLTTFTSVLGSCRCLQMQLGIRQRRDLGLSFWTGLGQRNFL